MARCLCSFLLALLAAAAARGGTPVAPAARGSAPRLAVVISIDQFRRDYLDRFHAVFTAGGFRRLQEQGVDFPDCHYRHAYTKTAPGHALMLSGRFAAQNGIVGNEWIDRTTWRQLIAVEDPAAPLVGPAPRPRSPGGVLEAKEGRSPRNFHGATIGDQLKERYGAEARVIAIANKDRAAILLGGPKADGVYWFDRGRFVTSRYYRAALPEWVEAFNREERMVHDFGRTWERLLAPEIYERLAGPDDAPGEDPAYGLGLTFPHRIGGDGAAMSSDHQNAYPISPFYSEIVADMVKAAVRSEQLGRHAGTDLLAIGFSQLDYTGHAFGPQSQEVMDAVLRLDRIVADLLGFLDREVGAGNYVVVLTADHGVAPIPEQLSVATEGRPGGRLDQTAILRAVEQALDTAFGAPTEKQYWVVRDGAGFHFRPDTLAAKQVGANQAAEVVRRALLARPEVAAVCTRAELEGSAPLDPQGEMMRRSFNRERSPDVLYVTKPYWVDRAKRGTNHGTPYEYDTHVPLLWYGAGVKPALRRDSVGVEDLAPTLDELLGLPPLPQVQGRRLF